MIPVSGSAYAYSYATLGEIVAWFIGWNLVLEYLFAVATVAASWSGYFNECLSILGHWTGMALTLPDYLSTAPLKYTDTHQIVTTGALINLPAVLIVAGLTWLCYVGITQSTFVNSVIVTIKVLVIALFLIFAFRYIDPANWHPFIPKEEAPGRFGTSGIFRAAVLVFFSYVGFDAVSTAAGEAKNPQRDMPIGILGSLAICTVLYIAMALTLTGIAPYTESLSAADLAEGHRFLRCAGRPVVGDPGDVVGHLAHLLQHGEGWPAAQGHVRCARQAPHAARGHDHRRRRRAGACRPVPGEHPGRAGVDGHLAGLHHRVHRRADPALYPPRPAALVPRAGHLGGEHSWRGDLPVSVLAVVPRQLAAHAGLDRHRHADLFPLWVFP
jgi:hypothetical protein